MKFEYLREFEPEFEDVLGYELGAHMGSIHEKTMGQILYYCTFKPALQETLLLPVNFVKLLKANSAFYLIFNHLVKCFISGESK